MYPNQYNQAQPQAGVFEQALSNPSNVQNRVYWYVSNILFKTNHTLFWVKKMSNGLSYWNKNSDVYKDLIVLNKKVWLFSFIFFKTNPGKFALLFCLFY